ncbi:hypothetical protein GTY75_08940 [Streptomyces sp. SID8381]|uniref:hypothetical protein n=1 Tax=unclassified Streptomyces TaxID=2593676 RepID=UPI00036AE6D0|nr:MULTISPECIES: hypothetical protein [unclassified Streptomyces]MYX26792.1 hypothetical protein [Streptomyces sp. SID8381]
MSSALTKPAVRIFRHVHRLHSCRTKDGVVELQEPDATRIDSMLEAAAVCMDVPPHEGRPRYDQWVQAEQPPPCDCPPCAAVREALRFERERLEAGGYRDAEGFWVLPETEQKSTAAAADSESPTL